MPLLYYGLVIVGTAALLLAVYNLIIIKRCGGRRRHVQSSSSSSSSSSQPSNRVSEAVAPISQSYDGLIFNRNLLLSSFKYKKEAAEGESECPVCLCGFEEGEEVRNLPRCKHSFHAHCIDMWLFSHFDCPICRTPVLHFCQLFPPPPPPRPPESSGDGLLRSAINGVAVWGLDYLGPAKIELITFWELNGFHVGSNSISISFVSWQTEQLSRPKWGRWRVWSVCCLVCYFL